jgi:hypothetical protein
VSGPVEDYPRDLAEFERLFVTEERADCTWPSCAGPTDFGARAVDDRRRGRRGTVCGYQKLNLP